MNYSPGEVRLRAGLAVGIAVLTSLLSDNTFRSAFPPLALTGLGALDVGMVAYRAFIDKSASQQVPSPVEEEQGDEPNEEEPPTIQRIVPGRVASGSVVVGAPNVAADMARRATPPQSPPPQLPRATPPGEPFN